MFINGLAVLNLVAEDTRLLITVVAPDIDTAMSIAGATIIVKNSDMADMFFFQNFSKVNSVRVLMDVNAFEVELVKVEDSVGEEIKAEINDLGAAFDALLEVL